MSTIIQFVRLHFLTILAVGFVFVVIPYSIVSAFHDSTWPPENCGNGSISCSGSGGSSSNEGQTCYSGPNACGATNQGIIIGGTCQARVQTGTNGKGQPIYKYYPISTPANPANYGAACSSATNACGAQNTGTIQCNGQCSVSAAPALPAGYGNTCQSAANACGVRSTGTIQCNGQCSVSTAPALPANYGAACSSPTNACGVRNTGSIQCNGQCSVSTSAAPALPSGYGNSCQSAANSCGMRNSGIIQCSGSCSAAAPAEILCSADATQTLEALPRLVQPNATSQITWSSTNASSCTVVGNGDSWTGTSGTRTTSPITETATYVMTCIGLNTRTVIKSVTIDIVPVWREL